LVRAKTRNVKRGGGTGESPRLHGAPLGSGSQTQQKLQETAERQSSGKNSRLRGRGNCGKKWKSKPHLRSDSRGSASAEREGS